jgi:hypothetical protein
MAYAEMLMRKLDPGASGPPSSASGGAAPNSVRDPGKDASTRNAAQVIFTQAERMAEIVRKIGKITKYETKSYVGRARILDLDKAAGGEDVDAPQEQEPASSAQPRAGAYLRRRE